MKASIHVSTSAMLAAALYVYSGSVPMAASCLASGVLIDLDHVVDFHLFSGERFSIANFFSWCNECRWQRITLIFHSYELFGILCAVAYYLDNAVLRGIVWERVYTCCSISLRIPGQSGCRRGSISWDTGLPWDSDGTNCSYLSTRHGQARIAEVGGAGREGGILDMAMGGAMHPIIAPALPRLISGKS